MEERETSFPGKGEERRQPTSPPTGTLTYSFTDIYVVTTWQADTCSAGEKKQLDFLLL